MMSPMNAIRTVASGDTGAANLTSRYSRRKRMSENGKQGQSPKLALLTEIHLKELFIQSRKR